MALSENDVKKLVELFKDVGFEGLGGAKANELPDIQMDDSVPASDIPSDSGSVAEVDDDIMALLEDSPSDTRETETPALDAMDDEFSFLDEPGEKTSRLASKIKKRDHEEIIPVTSNTFPEGLLFAVHLAEDRLVHIFNPIGEGNAVPEKAEQSSFLEDEDKGESRLMSRVKKPKKGEEEIVENNSFPESLKLNMSLDKSALSRIFTGIGETKDVSSTEVKTSYLDDESKGSSRLMSRVKQHQTSDDIVVDNNTMPKILQFKVTQTNQELVERFRNVGE